MKRGWEAGLPFSFQKVLELQRFNHGSNKRMIEKVADTGTAIYSTSRQTLPSSKAALMHLEQ